MTLVFIYAVVLGRIAVRDAGGYRLAWFGLLAFILQNFYSPLVVGREASVVLGSYGPTTVSFLVLGTGLGSTLSFTSSASVHAKSPADAVVAIGDPGAPQPDSPSAP